MTTDSTFCFLRATGSDLCFEKATGCKRPPGSDVVLFRTPCPAAPVAIGGVTYTECAADPDARDATEVETTHVFASARRNEGEATPHPDHAAYARRRAAAVAELKAHPGIPVPLFTGRAPDHAVHTIVDRLVRAYRMANHDVLAIVASVTGAGQVSAGRIAEMITAARVRGFFQVDECGAPLDAAAAKAEAERAAAHERYLAQKRIAETPVELALDGEGMITIVVPNRDKFAGHPYERRQASLVHMLTPRPARPEDPPPLWPNVSEAADGHTHVIIKVGALARLPRGESSAEDGWYIGPNGARISLLPAKAAELRGARILTRDEEILLRFTNALEAAADASPMAPDAEHFDRRDERGRAVVAAAADALASIPRPLVSGRVAAEILVRGFRLTLPVAFEVWTEALGGVQYPPKPEKLARALELAVQGGRGTCVSPGVLVPAAPPAASTTEDESPSPAGTTEADPWTETIARFLHGRDIASTEEILAALADAGLKPAAVGNAEHTRIRTAAALAGFTKRDVAIDGKNAKRFVRV